MTVIMAGLLALFGASTGFLLDLRAVT